ncbi:MAG: alpha-L-rhamnosidase [Bacteroidota bacterium]
MMRYLILCLPLLVGLTTLPAQDWTARPWAASWITHPTAPATEFAVVNFRRTFNLATLPDSLPVLVSADNRYQLFVNGQRVGEGPARGDLLHWRYEQYDLKPYLKAGDNVIAAIVWNYGIDKPWSQQSYRLGFLLQPATAVGAELLTNEQWLTYHNKAYTPITTARERLGTYIVTGPQLRIDGKQMPWGWEQVAFEDGDWPRAVAITRGSPAGNGTETYWGLVPRSIPHFPRELLDQPLPVRVEDIETKVPEGNDTLPLHVILPNSSRKILFQFRSLVNAFHSFQFREGKGAKVRVAYAESLVDTNGEKGNRNEIGDKQLKGIYDEFLLDGEQRRYATPWFRTGRFLEFSVENGADTLYIEDIRSESFAYPFTEIGSFELPDQKYRTEDIWSVGWQTARMCAQETYVDCPYYEQLQYIGDTRIQALISLYVTGDDRLMRKAIKIFDESRMSDGLTQSRYPSNVPQYIPPYSLSWVEMVGDYWMHRPDTDFVRARLEGVRAVLRWYDQQVLPNGMIGNTPYWNFVDWTPDWPWNDEFRIGGVPDLEGGSSIISLQYVSALRVAQRLYDYFGDWEQASIYGRRADKVARAVTQLCWKADRGLFSDTPKGKAFSQHANILALLTNLVPASAPEIMTFGSEGIPKFNNRLLDRILADESLTQLSEYFRFYLVQAMYHTGNAHLYLDQLKIWEAYLDQGFTTFPERPGKTRSDCHAWSASPNYDLLATLAGIRPGEPGFEQVLVRPAHLPGMEYYARSAHPKGTIDVNCSRSIRSYSGHYYLDYRVILPSGTEGVFIYGKQRYPLVEGEQMIEVDLGTEKVKDWGSY